MERADSVGGRGPVEGNNDGRGRTTRERADAEKRQLAAQRLNPPRIIKGDVDRRCVGSNPLAQGAGVIQDAGARGKVGEPVIIPLVKQVLVALDVEEAASLIVN